MVQKKQEYSLLRNERQRKALMFGRGVAVLLDFQRTAKVLGVQSRDKKVSFNLLVMGARRR